MTDAAWFLEIASYVFVTAFGAWLLWQKAGPLVRRLAGAGPAHSLSASACAMNTSIVTRPCHDHGHSQGTTITTARTITIMMGALCSTCGHSHARTLFCCPENASIGAQPGRQSLPWVSGHVLAR